LIVAENVRPEDILVVGYSQNRLNSLEQHATGNISAGIHKSYVPGNKDMLIHMPGNVTFSTVHSAKGYDAYCVIVVAANEFPTDLTGRACFYVACTRAREHLEVFAYEKTGLAVEFGILLDRLYRGKGKTG
jgi:superfamily I DNA and RNA helicase